MKSLKYIIKLWGGILNSFNTVKNMLVQPIVQVSQLTTGLTTLVVLKKSDISLLKSFFIIGLMTILAAAFYLFLAWLSYKFKIRQAIGSEDYKNTYEWPTLFKKLDDIEKLLKNNGNQKII